MLHGLLDLVFSEPSGSPAHRAAARNGHAWAPLDPLPVQPPPPHKPRPDCGAASAMPGYSEGPHDPLPLASVSGDRSCSAETAGGGATANAVV